MTSKRLGLFSLIFVIYWKIIHKCNSRNHGTNKSIFTWTGLQSHISTALRWKSHGPFPRMVCRKKHKKVKVLYFRIHFKQWVDLVLPLVCSVIDQGRRQIGVRTSAVGYPIGYRVEGHFFVLITIWRYLWSNWTNVGQHRIYSLTIPFTYRSAGQSCNQEEVKKPRRQRERR